MRDNDRLEDVVRKDLNVRAGNGTYARMRDIVLDAHGPTRETGSATALSITRRKIMRNPIVKFAVAAAVVLAVLLGVALFRSSGSGVVWAEVAQKVQASRGVSYRATERIVPDTYNQQVDFSMQYCTSTQSRLDGYKGGELIKTIWGDCNTKTTILVDHSHKSYVKMILDKEMPDRLRAADPSRWVQKFLSCKYKNLGQNTIDGVLCEGIETTDPAFYGGTSSEAPMARIWVSVETRYPVRFEGERVYDEARHTFVQDQFEWDVELGRGLFEPNIPAGYIDISP